MKTVIRPETEMKDSGIDTVEKMPLSWNKIRLKNLVKIRTGNEDTKNATPNGKYRFYVRSPIVERCDRYTFEGEAILVAGDGAGAGRIFHLVDGRYAVHQRVYCLSDFKYNAKFIHYYLGNLFPFEMDKGSAQSTVPSMRLPMLLNFKLVLPGENECLKIIDYLDETCSKIDEIIAEAKASIDEYKELKQSVIFEAVTKGLDKNVEEKECQMVSLQQIPKHWKECRMGTIYRESKEAGRTDLPILMISINTGISDGEVGDEERLRKVVRSEDKSVYKVVHKNDLAYNMMRAWQGGFGAAQVDGLVSPAYVVATPRTELDSRYIEALLRTPMFTEKIRGLSYGIADFRLRLYWNYFKDLKICLPPVDEQRKIADFIDEQNKMIEGLISEKQSLIADLEAYKKSLIYEVVTGKRRVV